MYGLATSAVKLGCTLRDLLQLRKEAGSFKGDPDRYAMKIVDRAGTFIGDPDVGRFAADGVETKAMELPDGRIISITNQAMPGGGWIDGGWAVVGHGAKVPTSILIRCFGS